MPDASPLQTKLFDQLVQLWIEAAQQPELHNGSKHSGVTSLEITKTPFK